MQKDFIDFDKYDIDYQIGSAEALCRMQQVSAREPFDERTINFLENISKTLLSDPEARKYPDVITLAFWMRKASLEGFRKKFYPTEKKMYSLGRGIAYHIAPSNVPVNYAYSLVTGLLCGNANIVRIPSRDFPQIAIINHAVAQALISCNEMEPYIVLVRYGHEKNINDMFSSIADVRIVWGGDRTIHELRTSPIKPRATEITFADRYSLAVIDSDAYLEAGDFSKTANNFYNDTYLTDQNACSSPRCVIWTGGRIVEAKKAFWTSLHEIVLSKYQLQDIQAINKLTSSYLLAVKLQDAQKEAAEDNLIIRMKVKKLNAGLMALRENSGFFFEYECKDILELREICNDSKCQTIAYIGNPEMFIPLIKSGIRGVDRIVPVGQTMSFELIWDGYNLFERMTRTISLH